MLQRVGAYVVSGFRGASAIVYCVSTVSDAISGDLRADHIAGGREDEPTPAGARRVT